MTPTTRPTALYDATNLRLGGRLNDIIRAYLAEGLKWEAIARRLYSEHGIEVSGRTVQRWAQELGIEAA